MSEFLVEQFEYDHWANLHWLSFIAEQDSAETYRAIMTHILGAQQIWVTRIEGGSLASIPKPGLQTEVIEELFERWKGVLTSRIPPRSSPFVERLANRWKQPSRKSRSTL